MAPILGMEEPWYYRNKAQFPVGLGKDGAVITGFYAGRTHAIIDNTHCYIQAQVNEKILEIVKQFLEENQIPPYQEESHTGLVRHVKIRFLLIKKKGIQGLCVMCLQELDL